MEEPSTFSVLCPILIGRSDEFAMLLQLAAETGHGQRRVAFVSGEAGVGKSRLVAETAHVAGKEGFLRLQGHCFQTDRSQPFAPFLDLLREYATTRTPEQITREWGRDALEFVRLLPEVAGLAPAFASLAPPPVIDAQQEKRRLFAALTHFFTLQAARQSLLIVIEDLHWCDDISLECLYHLAHSSARLPILILLTYRSDEVSASLRHWLATFDRAHLAQDVVLGRLSRAEVDAMLQTIFALHSSTHTGLLESIYELTDGNPFYIEEMLKSLIASGEIAPRNGAWERTQLLGAHRRRPPIPRAIQDVVYQRSSGLTPRAQQLLTLAAVAGRRFDYTLLQSLLQLQEREMLLLVGELMEAQLVVEESEDRFSFRHALTRQAIYSRLLMRERKALHRQLAETIEALHPGAPAREGFLVDLAYHYFEGGVWSKAYQYGQRAGHRSVALYSPRSAVELFSRALKAHSHLSEAPPAELYRARGQTYETLGEFERARSDYEQALDAARQARDGHMEWQGLLDLGFLWAGRDYAQAGRWFRQALDLAQLLADPRLQAQSLNRLGNWLVNTGQAESGLQAHHEALALSQRQQDTQGMAETLDLLGMANGIFGDTLSAVEHIRRAVELFRAQNDHQRLITSLTSYVAYAGPSWVETTYSVSESLENCSRYANEALQLARQSDALSDQAYAEWITAGTLAAFGEFGAARRHAQESLRIATEIGHAQWTAGAYFTLGRLYYLLQEATMAMDTLKRGLALSSEIGSAWWSGNITAYFAMACILKGAIPRAEAALTTIIPRQQTPRNSPERRLIWAWGELALANNEPEVALEIAERLIASAPGAHQDQPIPWLLRLKAKALLASGRMHEVIGVLEEAKQGLLARQERPLLWQVHASLGQVHTYLKQDKQARQEFAAAAQVIQALQTTIDDDYLRQHFTRMALKALPRDLSPSTAGDGSDTFHGLTGREYTVAARLAEGKTNREIADTLIIGERTVETHVSNILAKLDFTSRKQISAWWLRLEENR
jgi:predicted ATPase/DNA-binding NarL/FixJ family response regulator